MRVTHVITRLIVGGAQENTVATVLGLHDRNAGDPPASSLAVDLISGPTSGAEGSLESAFKASPEILSIVPELVRPVHPLKDFLALRKLETIFRKQKPDIVHTHSGKAGILGRLAARRAGVPVIIHTIHGPSFGAFQNGLSNFIFTAAERRAARATDHFIVVADAMTTQYLAAGIGQPSQYTKVFSGFPLEPFLTAKNDPALRAKLGLQPDDFVVGTIARLVKLKGHDDLFSVAPELIRHCPKIKFLLVGDGEYRTRFENLARSLQLERHFIFTGLVPPVEVPRYVGIMDALVHLSLREGLPRALPQALAAAKPVIAYDCDGAREICRDDETGFLISPGDKEKLVNCLLLLSGNENLCHRLGQSGQNFVRQNFSVAGMVDGIYAVYQKLAAERGLRL